MASSPNANKNKNTLRRIAKSDFRRHSPKFKTNNGNNDWIADDVKTNCIVSLIVICVYVNDGKHMWSLRDFDHNYLYFCWFFFFYADWDRTDWRWPLLSELIKLVPLWVALRRWNCANSIFDETQYVTSCVKGNLKDVNNEQYFFHISNICRTLVFRWQSICSRQLSCLRFPINQTNADAQSHLPTFAEIWKTCNLIILLVFPLGKDVRTSKSMVPWIL